MGKILVVDDQFGVRSLLVSILREDGHKVGVAANVTEALKVSIAFDPDLILLDMKLSGMNGIETLEKIRAINCRAAVIMMTGNGDDPKNIKQSKDLGILLYMVKPFDLFELRVQVIEILNNLGITSKGFTPWSLLPTIIFIHIISSYSDLVYELATFT